MQKVIGVIGESKATKENYKQAYEVGRLIALAGAALVCGGLSGVMEAACKGAKEAGGMTIGVIPFLDKSSANNYVDIVIPTGMGYARNVIVVHSADAVIAIGGRFGTLTEIGYALDADIPVIGLNTWNIRDYNGNVAQIEYAKGPEEAVRLALSRT